MATCGNITSMSGVTCKVADQGEHSPGRLRRGMCRKHYEREIKFGSPLGGVGRPHGIPLAERFWSMVVKTDTCWTWGGAWNPESGYGSFGARVEGKSVRKMAHRWAHELAIGPIPEGLQVDHLCSNRLCVRPDHLEAVTPRENTLRALDSPAGKNAQKTHCLRGHPLSGKNVYVPPKKPNSRYCKTCRDARSRRRVQSVL